ncbi:hypothetical protein A4U49_07890 [Acidithiobacillus ferrivorans]|nr:hypothetical protein A4U49_07890 [Acidithiobacillus ferrivorans]
MSMIPSLFATQLGVWTLRVTGPITNIVAAELVGAIGVLIPWLGAQNHSKLLLITGSMIPGMIGGVAVASYGYILKQVLQDDDYPAYSAIDALAFSASTVMGTGFAAILYNIVQIKLYFIGDIVSYFLAASLFIYIGLKYNYNPSFTDLVNSSHANIKQRMPKLHGVRLRAFLLLPTVAACTGSALALLPALGDRFATLHVASFAVSSTVLLIFARTIGQAIGPFVFPPARINAMFGINYMIIGLVSAYIFLYTIAFSISLTAAAILLVILLVILAHIASNIVFVVSNTAVFKYFKAAEIPLVSVRINQLTTLILLVVAVVAGKIATETSMMLGLIFLSLPSLALLALIVLTIKPDGPWMDSI